VISTVGARRRQHASATASEEPAQQSGIGVWWKRGDVEDHLQRRRSAAKHLIADELDDAMVEEAHQAERSAIGTMSRRDQAAVVARMRSRHS